MVNETIDTNSVTYFSFVTCCLSMRTFKYENVFRLTKEGRGKYKRKRNK